MTDNLILELQNIHLRLKSNDFEVKILNGIDLNVVQGKAVAILGASGSGKSSMMSVMNGLERQTEGSVIVAGHVLDNMNEDELAMFRRNNIGIILQAFHLIPTMTALENVAVPLELAGINGAEEIAKNMLVDVGLDHRMDHYPTQLSGGEQQRVAIARAMAPEPKILFADEPTGNLDGKTGHNIIELIFTLRQKNNATLILITHDQELAGKCDEIIHIEDGLIVDEQNRKVAE
ncbi:MAG: ATP-binding cassette domain-containing protein [Kordiimonadaceae bacterium]|jgi:putative ABC transport system ATP-binding protein|nr:ATP-binding cassette domain-containing protein [Kordiimonadaceae bacterium]MBT6035236.1 ATP-binding cassette domain-containing protein [Kordiimonadaceae bacterium]MBT6329125.1 ATP-binding cassette domain-containing protein [Kordiimonadaceae bacterium]MBT7583427.1 ATP-binding cassette domain-containing protein [Kordiimonadaceae bacterium]